ncbi:cysteine-rich CWC family protein [Psychrobium sp. nBUS_13]|uniref:cysteine-rich CWC family protein n=1 Tax=Psychrobium sp. nBUS_13 TaxID=3395319 RepID=UPI003EB864FF
MLQCPICHQFNDCQVTTPQSCWCMNENIPREMFSLISTEQSKKVCICLQCVTHFKQNPEIIPIALNICPLVLVKIN